jgi:hypothetical protein
MEKKQTSVEWLALYIKGITSLNCDEIIKQAKAMEKKQIINAYNRGTINGIDYPESSFPLTGEEYYNKTFEA